MAEDAPRGLTTEEFDKIPNVSFLRHPQNMTEEERNQFLGKLFIACQKDIASPLYLDWELAERAGLTRRLDQYLSQDFHNDSGDLIFTCRGWNNLFHLQLPIYKDYTCEFFSSVTFDPTVLDFTRSVFCFRLGGVSRRCSIFDLAWRLGLYSREETQSPLFRMYLEGCLTSIPEDFSGIDFWGQIATGSYEPRTAQESKISSPIFRLLHRLIATYIAHREGGDKVPASDLFYLWCLVTPGRFLNLPYFLAVFLARKAFNTRLRSPICGGHLVSRLVQSYSLPTGGLTVQPMRRTSRRDLETMRVIQRGTGASLRILPDTQAEDIPESTPADPPAPRSQRRRRIPAAAQAVPEPEIDLRYIVRRIDEESLARQRTDRDVMLLRQQVEWIGVSMSEFFATQSFYRPPFPTDHGASTSGTHHQDAGGDGDDDDEE